MPLRLQNAPQFWDARWGNEVVRAFNQVDLQVNRPAALGYSVTGFTETRYLNVTGATLMEVKQVLATMIDDFKSRGFLG